MIPLADGLGGVERLAGFRIIRRLIERVEPAAADRVFRGHVVFKLKLRPCAPSGVGRLRDVEHDAAVARVGDVVIQFQFKPLELFSRDDVSGILGINARKRSILHLPAGADGVGFEIMPAAQVIAVEDQLPSGGLLARSQGVRVSVADTITSRTGGERENQQSQCRDQICFHQK